MERARAISFLQFESHKNRHLPKIEPAKTYKQYLAWDDETALILRRWYVEDQQILSDRDYMHDVRSEEGLYLMPFGLIAFPKESEARREAHPARPARSLARGLLQHGLPDRSGRAARPRVLARALLRR